MASQHAPFRRRPRSMVAAAVALPLLFVPSPAHAQRGWGGTDLVSAVTTDAGASRVAVDASGVVTVAWTEPAGPLRAVKAARRAPAAAWTAPTTLGTAPGGADVAVAAAPAGGALVVWTAGDGGVYASRFVGGSGTWVPEVVAAPRATVYAHAPSLAIDGAGHALALWYLDGAERIEVARYDASSHTWGAVLDLGSGVRPLAAIDATGNAMAVWTDRAAAPATLRAARFTAGTGLWSPPAVIDANAVVIGLDLDVAPDGTAAALWYDEDVPRTASALSVAIYTPSTATWSAPTALSTTSPTGAVALAGHDVMAIWTTALGAAFSRADLAAAPVVWSAPALVDATVARPSGLFLGLAGDAQGGFVATWNDGTSVRASRYAASQAAWDPSVVLTATGVSGREPAAAITPAGTATVTWTAQVRPYAAVQAASWDATLGAPRLIAVSPSAGTFALEFAAPTARLAEFAATNVEYSIDGGTTWIVRTPASLASPLVVTGLSDTAAYLVALRAVNVAGPGATANAGLVRTGTGSTAPGSLHVADVVGDLVTFTWDPPLAGATPTQYVVEGGVAPGAPLVAIPTASPATVFSLRVPPGTYFVRVRAAALETLSGPSNEVRVVVGASVPPSAPAHLLGLVNGSALALSWTNTFEGGPPEGLWLAVTGPVGGIVPLGLVESFQYAAAPPGTYTFQVVAANAAGQSALSNAVTLTFPGPCTGPPGPPLTFRAATAGTTISLRWSPPDSGAAVTSYRVLVGTFGDPAPAIGATRRGPLYGFSVPIVGHQISGTLPPDYYNFFLSAVNPCGESVPIGPLSVSTR